ncbi:RecX family transcriptional regulator [Canibacter oris]|uniref:Regulatory protein RecX n=1 Tax=Canibacter oris TaxID=1365628 RepID=A0A840DNF6_9MICO|nr:RecX family transcriptional regulator [Canibacter oris]MBB4071578.1 SOS response regulatory protein OraA/RecX [Canibacter oris]
MVVRFTEETAGSDSDSGAISLNGWLRRRAALSHGAAVSDTGTTAEVASTARQNSEAAPAAAPQKSASSTEAAHVVESVAAESEKQQRLAVLRRMISAAPASNRASAQPASERMQHKTSAAVSDVAPANSAVAAPASRKHAQRALQAVTADNAADLLATDKALQAARDMATRQLARKQLSSAELAALLRRNEVAAEIVETVIAEFTAASYLDDAALAESLVEKLGAAKGNSRHAVRRKLMQRKLGSAVIDSALAALDEQEQAALLIAAAESRALQLQGLDYSVAKRRLLSYLARRGWGGYEAAAAAEAALAAAGIGGKSVYFS